MELRESRRMIISSSPHKESVTGSVATFKTDMAKPLLGCNVGIDLVQDLHGQTKPYPAGGGKNLFNLNIGIHENLYRDDNGNEVATENSNYTDPLGG